MQRRSEHDTLSCNTRSSKNLGQSWIPRSAWTSKPSLNSKRGAEPAATTSEARMARARRWHGHAGPGPGLLMPFYGGPGPFPTSLRHCEEELATTNHLLVISGIRALRQGVCPSHLSRLESPRCSNPGCAVETSQSPSLT